MIGRAVVERLLARGVNVTLMLRAEAEERRKDALDALLETAGGANGSLTLVTGDLLEPEMGLSQAGMAALGDAGHCFHLAALYDIEADPKAIEKANVDGTRNVLAALQNSGFEGRLHHASSIAVAGDYADTWQRVGYADKRIRLHLAELFPRVADLDTSPLELPEVSPAGLGEEEALLGAQTIVIKDAPLSENEILGAQTLVCILAAYGAGYRSLDE